MAKNLASYARKDTLFELAIDKWCQEWKNGHTNVTEDKHKVLRLSMEGVKFPKEDFHSRLHPKKWR